MHTDCTHMHVWLLKIAAQVNNRFRIKYDNVVVVFFHGLYRTNTEFKSGVQRSVTTCS